MTSEAAADEGLETVATIVATVDLDRALAALGLSPAGVDVVEDPHLGARVVVVEDPDGLLAIAEPSTEGRLAASLARHGAGAQGRYARPTGHPSLAGYVRSLVASGGIASRIAPGPFGPSVLVVSRSIAGPHLVVVDADAAIRPAASPVPSSGRDSDD